MQRIRINIKEVKTGYKAIYYLWDTEVNHGFYDKRQYVLEDVYPTYSKAIQGILDVLGPIERETLT